MDKLHLVSSVDQIRMAPPNQADGLPLTIPYTSTGMARQALRAAENLSRGLNVSVRLVAVQIVPFPCPVNQPPVALRHIAGPLERLAAEADIPVEVNIVLARDVMAGYLEVLPHDSLVLMAARKRWWPTPGDAARAPAGPRPSQRRRHHRRGGQTMQDLFFLTLTVVFFVLSWAYVLCCERL